MTTLITLLLPLAGAIALFLWPKGASQAAARYTALGFAALTLASSVALIGGQGNAFAVPWVPTLGISFNVGVDGLSVFLVVLTALLTLAALAFTRETERTHAYFGLVLLLEASAIGAFVSLDLFLFYVFWELMIIPAYFLIGGYGGARRREAALKFLIYSLVPSLFMLVGILVLVWAAFVSQGFLTFSLAQLIGTHLSLPYQYWIFLSFMVAFLVKVPVWPLHSWMPDAYGESPPAVAALLTGVLSKTGLYAMLRLAMPLFPEAARVLMPYLAAMAIISILYGAVIALTHRDGRMVIAYSSLSHLGLVFLGIVALNALGLDGAVLQMVNHGLYAAALFLLFGLVEGATGTRDIGALGGLARKAPVFAGFFLFVIMAAAGLPGLNGFAGEFMLLIGIFKTSPLWAYLGILAAILAGAYFLRLFQASTQGPKSDDKDVPKVPFSSAQVAVLAPFLALMLLLGLAPGVIVNTIHPATTHIVQVMGQAPSQRQVSDR